jgi:hypothetical protein
MSASERSGDRSLWGLAFQRVCNAADRPDQRTDRSFDRSPGVGSRSDWSITSIDQAIDRSDSLLIKVIDQAPDRDHQAPDRRWVAQQHDHAPVVGDPAVLGELVRKQSEISPRDSRRPMLGEAAHPWRDAAADTRSCSSDRVEHPCCCAGVAMNS